MRGPSRGSDLLKVTAPWRLSQSHGASLLSSKPPHRPTDRPILPSCSGLAVNWGPCAPWQAGHGVEEKPRVAGSAIPQPPVGTVLLPDFFPPGPGCWRLRHSEATSGACHQAWGVRDPPSLGLSSHLPSASPSGWPVGLTPAALHPNAVRTFPAVNSHRTPSSPATNSKHGSLQACIKI